jgi:hypothetical protein
MFIILIYRNFILQFPLFEGHMKNHKSFFAILIITLSISLSLFADTARYDVDMTIRQISKVGNIPAAVRSGTGEDTAP